LVSVIITVSVFDLGMLFGKVKCGNLYSRLRGTNSVSAFQLEGWVFDTRLLCDSP